MRNFISSAGSKWIVWLSILFASLATSAFSTPYTMTVPGTGVALPAGYPQAGGIAMVFTGANGNIYYQFSNPAGAFVGFNSTGTPAAFQGNPFTINDPITLDCGFSSCTDYFGGSIASIDVRFSAFDGDTQVGGFDYQDITLQLNGFSIGGWSDITAENTDDAGTTSFGFTTGFGNNVFTTSWFNSTDPALLANILTTGSVTTQVFDADPDDNYWDFSRGNNLADNGIVTVAPGYTLEKTAHSGSADGPAVTQYASAGDVIQVGDTVYFKYIVTNIGSVDISNLSVVDDKVATITCDKTVILAVPLGSPSPDFATCTGAYIVTQADVDNGSVTNVASAAGTPTSGQLGTLSDTVTLNGPALVSGITLDKTASVGNFGAAGNVFSYDFTITNTGNSTLSNVSVSDPRIPGLVCTFAEIKPLSALNNDNTETCSGNYTVTQADVDAFAINGTQLTNVATVTSVDPDGNTVSATDSVSLPGLPAAPAMTVEKNAAEVNFDAVGDVINYTIKITNTGNVTFPAPPAVTDSLALTTGPTCPTGTIAPAASVTCTATYTILQSDLDARTVHNQADATITVGGVVATGSDTADVAAVINTGLEIVKQLAAASPTNFNAVGVDLTYDYILTNTGNVSLTAPSVTDDKVTVVCPAGDVAPGDSVTCTSTADPYPTTQADLDAGGITNTASASATAVGGVEVVNTADVTLTVPAVQEPAMTVVKTAPNVDSADFAPGLVVTYSYQVKNTGNVSLIDQITITDDHIAGAFNCGTQTPASPLAVGGSVTCTADYTVTAQDVADGAVTNIASATDGTTTSPTDTETIPQSGTPSLALTKTAAEPNFNSLADTLSYTFVVTNTGDTNIVDLTPITINDPLVGAVDCSAQPATLAPGQSFNCTATYSSITQAQMDAGEVVNTATASFEYTGGGGGTSTITSPEASATVPSNAVAALTLNKQGPAQFEWTGSQITYTFSVTNDGPQTLTSVDITDPLIGAGVVCTIATIAPGATDSCTANYTITQADVDAETIHNEATATGTTQTGATATDTATDDTPVNANVATKVMTFAKTADKAAFATVGETIVYTFSVANTGLQTLTNIAVNDPLLGGVVCNIASIAPGSTDSSCTASYTVTQDDVDAGSRLNTATATADGGLSETDSVTVNGPARNAALNFSKTAGGGYTVAGDTVTFTMAVENTGNVRLNGVVVTDAFFDPDLTCNIGTIDPGVTDNSCVGVYTVTQADVDAGSITNTAAVIAAGADGTVLNDTDSETVTGPAAAPAIHVVKTEQDGSGTFDALPDTEVFTFTVQNTGNVTLTNIVLTDANTGFNCPIDDLAPGAFAPSCTGGGALQTTATMVQADMDTGSYSNTATVNGESTQGTAVTDGSTVTLVSPVQTATMDLAKSITSGSPFSAVGDNVVYSYIVTNSGNTTLTAPITISDDKIASVTCAPLPVGGLAPAAQLTCSGTYQITQADLDAGSVTNIAHAQTSAFGSVITSPDDQQTATATQTPTLSLDKHVKAGTVSTYDAPNDTVIFEYVVTNTGNVTTTAPVTIADDKIPGNLNCAPAGIAPGASVTCEQTWTAVQADVTAGSVTNIATADTTFGGNPVQSAPDSVTINAIQTPSLAIVKSITSQPASLIVGGELAYQYDVTNNGNVTFQNNITVSDNMIAVVCPALPAGGLLPGATLVCATDPLVPYVISSTDLDLGSVTNIASATTTFNGQAITSPTDSEIFPAGGSPALSITKTATVAGGTATFSQLGDIIHYSFSVQNTGDPDLIEDIFINDPLLGGSQLCHTGLLTADASAVPAGNGEITVCDAQNPVANAAFDYQVTQADLDRGFILNEATATTIFAPASPNPVNVVSPSDTATVNAATNPALDVLKEAIAGNNPAALNDVLTYRITTTNSGNQTISGITVTDPLIPVLTCTVAGVAAPANIVLAPTETVICEGTYTVTQTDLDTQVLGAAVVENTATSEGSNPQGGVVTATASTTHPLQPSSPAMTVVKTFTSGSDKFIAVGQNIEFSVEVTNTGNVTLASIDVTDDLDPGVICTVGPLVPNASDNTCRFNYTITQDDIDNGSYLNTASADAQPEVPGSPQISATGTATGNGPTRMPASSLLKVADKASVSVAGETINYTFTVANTGNVSLFGQPSVTDDKIGTFDCGTIPVTGLQPTEFVTCTVSYVVTQADMDVGTVVNNAFVGGMQVIDDPAGPTFTAVPNSPTVTETVDGARTPSISITKTASDTTAVQVGDVITYTYNVTNTGNVTLSAVTLNDQHTSAAGTATLAIAGDVLLTDSGTVGDSTDAAANGIWDTLAPADVVRFTSSYTITQADIDAGNDITNTVSVTTTSPPGTTAPTATAGEVVEVESADPRLVVLKTMTATPTTVGGTVQYHVTVENTGNVTLTNIVPTDTLLRNDGSATSNLPTLALQSGDNGVAGVMEIGETWVYTASYVLEQADIDAGGIRNSVRVTGAAPDGRLVEDTSDDGTGAGSKPTTLNIASDPGIVVLKTMTAAPTTVGATVEYDITVENTGNVTLGSVAISSDTLTRTDNTVLALTSGPSFVTATAGSAEGTLQVGETATYHATYVLTQGDVDAGGIINTATAVGTPPVGGSVSDVSDDGTGGAGGDTPTSLPIAAAPAMELTKTASTASFDTLGQLITFTFTVTNTGNVTLTDPFTVTDAMITDAGGTITCAAPPLAPNNTLDCTGTYAVTQADLDAGVINNSATISDGTTTSPPATETVTAVQAPAMEVEKVADLIDPAEFIVGAVVNYTYTVTNTGNVTITDPISISDNLIATADITCPAMPVAGVPPLGTHICTGTYEVTVNDVALASATNIASATDGTTTSPNTSETIPSGATPALTIAKTATAGADFTAVGDIVSYEYTVTNTGTASFATEVVVHDDKIVTPIVCFDPAGPAGPDLIAGEAVTCTADYTVTQDDLDAGFVTNQAYAQTTYAGSTDVVSAPQTVTVNADTSPELTVSKSAETLPVTAVGQVLTYTITLENTGNQTLTDVSATDPLIPTLVCQVAELTVAAPGNKYECTGTYEVLQSDIDAGTLVNTANATATDPQGGDVTGTGSSTVDMPAADPKLEFTKSATPSPFGVVGSAITYTFTVKNTGNVTLLDAHVTDALDPAYDCAIASIAPGAIDNSCTMSLTVTQDHVDAGKIENTATVTATDPFNTPVTESDTITTNGPLRIPGLEVTKTAAVVPPTVGTAVPYTLSVVNTGNVSIAVTGINDTMTREGGSAIALDAPFMLISGDTDADGLLDVTETWVYTASHSITQDDINAGGFHNTATVSGTGPSGAPVSDVSDNGNDSDGNTTDDPTSFEIIAAPSLVATKVVGTAGNMAGDTVSFTITVLNNGNVTLDTVAVVDTLTRADGTPLMVGVTGPTFTGADAGSAEGVLLVGETATYTLGYLLTQEDVDAGGIRNTVIASGIDPNGDPVSDVSDNGDNTDGNTTDDPTIMLIVPTPGLDVVKTLLTANLDSLAPGDEVRFGITAQNTGNVTLTSISMVDTLTDLAGTTLTPTSVTYAGDGTLDVGEVETWDVRYIITQDDIDAGGIQNTATVTGTTPTGGIHTDVSDDGDDTDGNTSDDPTVAAITPIETAEVSKTVNTPTRIGPNLYVATFTIAVTNTGNVTQTDMQVEDNLTTFVAPATLPTATNPPVVRVSGFTTATPNAAYDGVGDINLLSGTPKLAPGETGTIEIDVFYDISTGSPDNPNTATVLGLRIPPDTFAVATAPIVGAAPDILATKTVTPANAKRGDSVTYTITFVNGLATAEAGLTLVDKMPAGLMYTVGTATFNGAAAPAPVHAGQLLTWPGIRLEPSDGAAGGPDEVVITLQARVTGGGGTLTNEAFVLDSAGNTVSNIATATLKVAPEHVLDCSDIIGKVFDDKDMDGYQDQGEPGLAGVRLATVTGELITTDAYGRFHMPCAELPSKIGSNFILKLDTHTLPSGYRVTTENPRVIRVTAGKFGRLNFGAALSNVVDIDLTSAAFDPDDGTPSETLKDGIINLVKQLNATPSVIRLSYYRLDEDDKLAKQRLKTVEKLLRQAWRGQGRYRLLIERTIKRMQ